MHASEAKGSIQSKIDSFASLTCQTADNCDKSYSHCLTSLKFGQLKTKLLKQNFNRHKCIELWTISIKNQEFRTPFLPHDIRKNLRACAPRDGVNCSKNRYIVPYHRASPNTRNGAHLRSPSPIMAPGSMVVILLWTIKAKNIFSTFLCGHFTTTWQLDTRITLFNERFPNLLLSNL